jgi:hypothetical protein
MLQTILPAVATQVEIAYDSGTLGDSVSLPYTSQTWVGGQQEVNMRYTWTGNSMLAVRFTPGNGSEVRKLVGLRFYITGTLARFNVWILTPDRQFLVYNLKEGPPGGSAVINMVYSWTVTPTSTGWVYCNVTSEHTIFVSDDFYAAIEFPLGSQQESLGVDKGGQKSDRSWFAKNQTVEGWFEYSAYAEQHGLPVGNLMVRAVTTPVYEVTTTTTTKNTIVEWELPTAVALAILVVATIGVWLIRRRRKAE